MRNPSQSISDEEMRVALAAFDEHGSKTQAAKALGLARSTYKRHLKKAQDAGLHLSRGARNVVEASDLKPAEAAGGWVMHYDPDTGKKVASTRWKPPELTDDDVLDKLAGAFDNIKPAPKVEAPRHTEKDLLTFYPVMDGHLGMLAWGAETGGQNYDIQIALDDLRHAFAKLSVITPDSDRAILCIGGDFFHADDTNGETPQSKHKLDVDGRHFKVLDAGIQILAEVIEGLAAKHRRVVVRVLRGNHDPHAHLVLTFALAQRYRQAKRIEIEKNPQDLFTYQWGRCLISAHHGDKALPERLSLYLSDVCPFWSETRHRHCFTGHVHKDQAKDVGPVRWESLRAFCPPDSYAASIGYSGRRAMQAITFHKQDGLVLRALDPIERLAA